MGLRGAAFKVGPLLNGKRLVMNIANDMRPRFKHHVTALNGTFHSAAHNHSLGSDTSDDLGTWRDNKRSAMQVPLYLTIDFDEPFCRDIAINLQSVTNDRSITL